jgi:hypothetical protein
MEYMRAAVAEYPGADAFVKYAFRLYAASEAPSGDVTVTEVLPLAPGERLRLAGVALAFHPEGAII